MMRFRRQLGPRFISLLGPGRPLRFLLERPPLPGAGGMAAEAQFRERNTLSLYAGLTRVLNLRFDEPAGLLWPDAHKTYGIRNHGVRDRYELTNVAQLEADLRGYLAKVEVSARYIRREGQCQAWLSYRYGAARAAPDEWACIDREVVIGFTNGKEADAVWQRIRALASRVTRALSPCPERFGSKIGKLRIGGELDAMMWDPFRREFLVVEVKGRDNASGTYLAPLQVGCYLAAWRAFAQTQPAEALCGLCELLAQKRQVGLIRGDCKSPGSDDLRFRPVIVIQEANPRSSCWASLRYVREHVTRVWTGHPHAGASGDLLEELAVFTVGADGRLEDITGWSG